MTGTAIDPLSLKFCAPRYFGDFAVGERFYLPSRTMTEGVFSAFQAASGDNHPIHYDRHYCKAHGHRDLLAHGYQVLIQACIGAGVLPQMMGPSLIGFIEQSSRFLKGVYCGDTLYPEVEIAALTPRTASWSWRASRNTCCASAPPAKRSRPPMSTTPIGFIGLGVMGEPMCLNLARRSGLPVLAHDLDPAPLARLAAEGVGTAAGLRQVAGEAAIVFLSLPGGPQVEQVLRGPDGLLAHGRPGQTVVDCSTAPVDLTRSLAADLARAGIDFADAPVARTRQAARDGTLSITVGASAEVFARIEPLLRHMGSEVLHCGPVGCGQVVKLMNNMVLFQTVAALAEAMAIGARAGVDEALLLRALGNGSADSFALRNHAIKAMLPRDFPSAAFPTDYAIKDATYAAELARSLGIEARGAELALDTLRRSSAAGLGAEYFPALIKLIAATAIPADAPALAGSGGKDETGPDGAGKGAGQGGTIR
jgi:3-hydroxyisobutyrate dehydrogenase-like beta-hydroxyacid dehydrogenase/acyl dehydratase